MSKRFSVIQQDSGVSESKPKYDYTKRGRPRKLKERLPVKLNAIDSAFQQDLETIQAIPRPKVYPISGLSFDTEPIDRLNPNQSNQPPVIRFKL